MQKFMHISGLIDNGTKHNIFFLYSYICRLDSLLDVNNFIVANGFVVNEFMVVNGFTVYGECNEFNEVIF